VTPVSDLKYDTNRQIVPTAVIDFQNVPTWGRAGDKARIEGMHNEGKRVGVAIPSDSFRNLLDLRNECLVFRPFLNEILQILVVLDASAVQAELRWRLRSRTKPDARTSLHEAIESGAVRAVAPLFLKVEVEKYIPLIANEIGVSIERVNAEWRLIQLLILFYEPTGDPSRFGLVDPKDADYALTARELDADFVRTNDSHFARMGLPVIGPELDAVLRDYARSTSVFVTFKVGSAFVLTIGVEALVETLRAIAACIRSLPPAVKALLILGVSFALFHPKSRQMLSESFKGFWERLRGMQPVFVSIAGPVLEQLAEAAATSHSTRKEIGSRLPARTKQTALYHACLICIRAAKPLSTAEITRRILANGYTSQSKSFRSYVRRLLRSDRRFVVSPDGLWSLRSAA
jgi:hypothetical protein